eukprot:gene4238-4945_t
MAPTAFIIACGMLGLSAALMGPWLERYGPKISLVFGAAAFTIGHYITALAIYTQAIWLLYLGYGIVGGFGLGLVYISPVATLQKFFPDHRGLASGFAVCGFGAGSIAFAKIPIPVIAAVGLPLTFVILGSVFFIQQQQPAVTMPKVLVVDALLSWEYRLIYLSFLANILFGLVTISRLSSMVQDVFGKDQTTASTIVSINGGFNLLGRVLFAATSDYIGRKPVFIASLTIQVAVIGALPTITSNRDYTAFVASMWILTTCFGGSFGTIPAFLSDMFGSNNIGAIQGVTLTAWSLAGVGGGLLFTGVFNREIINGHTVHDPIVYNTNYYWVLSLLLLAWVSIWFLNVTPRDRLFPSTKGQILRICLLGKMIRLSTSKALLRTTGTRETWRFLKLNLVSKEFNRMVRSLSDGFHFNVDSSVSALDELWLYCDRSEKRSFPFTPTLRSLAFHQTDDTYADYKFKEAFGRLESFTGPIGLIDAIMTIGGCTATLTRLKITLNLDDIGYNRPCNIIRYMALHARQLTHLDIMVCGSDYDITCVTEFIQSLLLSGGFGSLEHLGIKTQYNSILFHDIINNVIYGKGSMPQLKTFIGPIEILHNLLIAGISPVYVSTWLMANIQDHMILPFNSNLETLKIVIYIDPDTEIDDLYQHWTNTIRSLISVGDGPLSNVKKFSLKTDLSMDLNLSIKSCVIVNTYPGTLNAILSRASRSPTIDLA